MKLNKAVLHRIILSVLPNSVFDLCFIVNAHEVGEQVIYQQNFDRWGARARDGRQVAFTAFIQVQPPRTSNNDVLTAVTGFFVDFFARMEGGASFRDDEKEWRYQV